MKKFVALLTLILMSISTAASASNRLSVLCVEKSGAVSIEYSIGSRCADQDYVNLSSANQSSVSSASCPSCVDSSLSSSVGSSVPRVSAKALAAEPAIVPVAVIAASVFTHLNGMRAPPSVDSAPVRSAYLVQRSSIVILQ